MSEDHAPHPLRESLKQTSDRLSHMEERLNSQASMVSGFAATLDSYGRQLQNQNESIEKIFDIVSKPNKTNYGWLIGAVMLVSTIAFSFTAMVTTPMKDDTDKIVATIEVIRSNQLEAAHRLGQMESRRELMDTYIDINSDRLSKALDTVMALKGKVEAVNDKCNN